MSSSTSSRDETPTIMRLSEEALREWRENGAVKLEGFLDEYWLAKCVEKFEWSRSNPGPTAGHYNGSENYYNELTTLGTAAEAAKREAFLPLVEVGPFAEAAAQLWGGETGAENKTPVWYYDHELILKRQDGKTASGQPMSTRTPWHQDTAIFSFVGPEVVAFWICLDGAVSEANSLQVVKGSHRGPMYDSFGLGDKGTYQLPPIPSVRKKVRDGEWELITWELQSGDVIAFHPHTLHGGGVIAEPLATPERRTLVLRFFGEAAVYKQLPMQPTYDVAGDTQAGESASTIDSLQGTTKWLDGLKEGEPFWYAGGGTYFPLVRGSKPDGVSSALPPARL